MAIGVYLLCYLASYLASYWGFYLISGIFLICAALFLYGYDYTRSKNLVHLRGIFALFWVGGQGLSCLKLSQLQSDWERTTWICFALALVCFWVVFEVLTRLYGSGHDSYGHWRSFSGNPRPVYHMICFVTTLSVIAFSIEAAVLGYIPLFLKGVPHAYSEFHLTGVHYITVSCVLVPSLSVLFFYMARGRGSERVMLLVIFMTLISLAIPMLCVSRFQFIMAVVLAVLTYIALQKHCSIWYFIGMGCVLLPVYLLLSIARSHDVAYLNSIFEMKYEQMPIYITQPYMYIANNYDNFDCLVTGLPNHSYGMRSLFPVWALTGLKFLYPQLTNYPIYINKQELTTLTLFYDAFYDFGVIGVAIFSSILGGVAYMLVVKVREMRNPIGYLFYAQIAIYFILSFFTTWFSNPTIWFYFAVTALMALYYTKKANRRW